MANANECNRNVTKANGVEIDVQYDLPFGASWLGGHCHKDAPRPVDFADVFGAWTSDFCAAGSTL